MTELSKLKVSLTKHGSHKVAALLDQFDPDTVLASTWDVVPGINIDRAQARKTLSSIKGDKLPKLWHDAKVEGRPTINALVLVGIIFSHHMLIKYVSDGITSPGQGTITRATVDNSKAFTNLADDFKELQFKKKGSISDFEFDFRSIVENDRLGPLVTQLLKLKLVEAKWDGSGDAVEEFIRLKFHKVFGLSKDNFRQWLIGVTDNLDVLPEQPDVEEEPIGEFVFKAGHTPKGIGDVIRRGHGENAKARRIHNDIQNVMYAALVAVYGEENVATEARGVGLQTSVDVVLKRGKEYTFYEVKTSLSLRKCIREAIPQLIEYANWVEADRASELVIVTTHQPSSDAEKYLAHLRTKYNIPLFHETVDRKTGALSSRI